MVRWSVILVMTITFFYCSKDPNQPEPADLAKRDLKVLEQGNQFGFELFELLSKENPDSNLCISPYSIYTALAMAANGAGNQTLDELLQLLGYSEDDLPALNESVKTINSILITKDPATVFETANSVWYSTTGFSVYPDFVNNLQNYFSARVEGLDFNSPAALPTINGWVREQTHEKIEKIIDTINPEDICFLINALYFNGKWTTPFDKKDTHIQSFIMSAKVQKAVPTMFLMDKLSSINTEDLQAVKLPYGDGSWSMYLFLPPYNQNLDDWCSQQLSVGWDDLRDRFKPIADMKIYLPSFKFECSLELGKQLKQLGIPNAFSDQADFSKMGTGPIRISQVLHKTMINVNEDGTEAAAITGVVAQGSDLPVNEIRFNHPFIFLIAEESTGSIIFIGKLNNPPQL